MSERPPDSRAPRAVEALARAGVGRLTALLARHARDLCTAEDALQEALTAALQQWPRDGVPTDPDAWLYRVARRKLASDWRKLEVRRRHASRVQDAGRTSTREEGTQEAWADHRLGLMLLCAHPAIDAAVRAPLMLQTVLGFRAEDLAGLMAMPAKTLGQRLWRAKRKIKDAGLPFEVPGPEALPGRVQAVLDALVGLFMGGHAASVGTARPSWRWEAVWLVDVLVKALPSAALSADLRAEVLGLAALLRHVLARVPAQHAADGAYVPLSAQRVDRWDAALVVQADALLHRAADLGVVGPLQLQAAVQSAVTHARVHDVDNRAQVLALHEAWVAAEPSLAARVSCAVARAAVHGPAAGLAALQDLPPEAQAYQPFWAARASLSAAVGDRPAAREAYQRAIEGTRDAAVADWLQAQRDGRYASSDQPAD